METQKIRVLLVEDDFSIVRNLSSMLEQEGFAVDVAMGQAQALQLFEQKEFDLLLLDISLPDGNGYAICTAVRKLSEVPVIFLTASGDEMNVVTGLDIGADDYITKPFRPMELLSRIKSVLRRRGNPLRCSRSKTSRWIPCGAMCGKTGRKCSFPRWNTACSWCSSITAGWCFPAAVCWNVSGMWRATLSTTIP